MSSPSLKTLPVELIYYLFNYLDIPTILFSFRYVCKEFQTLVNSYDRYKLDLRLISKPDFDRLCHVVLPEKVLSLVLTNSTHTPYQIRTFLSKFSFDQFYRLQSLDLIRIEENNLFSILMQIPLCSLKSLSINCFLWDKFSYTIRVLLSSTIEKSKLERLTLNISYKDLDMSSWPPLPTTLKYLCLERCTFQEYCMILRHTINLEELVLTECLMYNTDGTIYQPSDLICATKLKSLSFGACFMRMKELLILLSFTPTLVHMKLIIWTDLTDSVIDGRRWEYFISKNLLSLKEFEFFFDDLNYVNYDSLVDIQSYIESFQTPFWLKEKQWYVVCDYIKVLSIVRLYSLPICNSLLTYYTNLKKISCSTEIPNDNHIHLNHRVNELNLNLNETIEANDEIQVSTNLLIILFMFII